MTAIPQDRLLGALDPAAAPPAPPKGPEPTVYSREEPGRHPADEGRDLKVLREMGETLRRVVHDQLVADLPRLALGDLAEVRLDFRGASARAGGRAVQVHGGQMAELTGVRVLIPGKGLVHRGPVTFLRDELADEFYCWWDDGQGLPEHVWRSLDMGVQRRLAKDPAFVDDPRVQGFSDGHEVMDLA